MISTKVVNGLIIVTVSGEITAKEMLKAVSDYLASHGSLKALWDFSGAQKVEVTTNDLRNFAAELKTHFKDTRGRKVALAGSGNINIGLGRLFTVFAAFAGLPNEYKVFRKVEHAIKWLQG
jgi:hypothetical protein